MDLNEIFIGTRFDHPNNDDWVVIVQGKMLLGPMCRRCYYDTKKQAQNAFRTEYRWRVSNAWGKVTGNTGGWSNHPYDPSTIGWKTFLHEADVQFMTYGEYVKRYKSEQ